MGKFLSHGTLSEKEIEEWVKRQQETAESRERALKQFEEDERLAEKQSREITAIFGETVRDFISRNFKKTDFK